MLRATQQAASFIKSGFRIRSVFNNQLIEVYGDTHRFPGLIPAQDTEPKARVLPPQEDVLLLAVWH